MILPHDHGNTMEKLLHHMPAAEEIQELAEVFRQLSDGSRLRIFWILCHGEVCVANLSAMVGMSSPAVSHHLRILKDAASTVIFSYWFERVLKISKPPTEQSKEISNLPAM